MLSAIGLWSCLSRTPYSVTTNSRYHGPKFNFARIYFKFTVTKAAISPRLLRWQAPARGRIPINFKLQLEPRCPTYSLSENFWKTRNLRYERGFCQTGHSSLSRLQLGRDVRSCWLGSIDVISRGYLLESGWHLIFGRRRDGLREKLLREYWRGFSWYWLKLQYYPIFSVGDNDNFRLYHMPGFGWRWPLKFRFVPKSREGMSKSIGYPHSSRSLIFLFVARTSEPNHSHPFGWCRCSRGFSISCSLKCIHWQKPL